MQKIFLAILSLNVMICSSLSGAWIGPVTIFSAQTVQNPVVGVDAMGNSVIAATVSDDLSTYYQKAAQLVQGTMQNIHNFPFLGLNQGKNAISVNDSGDAAAVWMEYDNANSRYFLRSAELIGGNWGVPTTISNFAQFNVDFSSIPGIYLDAASEGIALWEGQSFIPSFNTQVNRFSSSWQGVQDLSTNAQNISSAVLSGSPSGNAIALWCEGDPFILRSAYFNGSSWAITNISSDIFPNGNPLTAVSMNFANNAVLLWNSSLGLSAAHFVNGSYGVPQTIFTTPLNFLIEYAVVALDDMGNAIALWSMDSSDGESKVLTSRFSNGVWGAPLLLDYTNDGSCLCNLNIGVDSLGNAYAVWMRDNGTGVDEVHYNQYVFESNSWKNTALLSQPGVPTSEPYLSVGAFGNATVVWIAGGNGNGIPAIQAMYTENLDPPVPPLPPQSFRGKQLKNKFFAKTELYNVLKWSASRDMSVESYVLYRNDKQLATFSAKSSFTYKDYNRKPGKTDIYKLIAVGKNGATSDPVFVTLP